MGLVKSLDCVGRGQVLCVDLLRVVAWETTATISCLGNSSKWSLACRFAN